VFHLVTLEQRASETQLVKGQVLTWQFRDWKGWTPSTYEAADFPHKAGFGCFETPEALGARVEREFRTSGEKIIPWTTIQNAVPELQFVPPSAFGLVGKYLREKGFDLTPFPPDEPKYIGVPL
jgi:hypothetical protein